VNRHYRQNYSHPFRINVTPKEAQWRYLSFRVLALEPGQTQQLNTGDSEVVVVPLSGEGSCAFGKDTFDFSRTSVFFLLIAMTRGIVLLTTKRPTTIGSGRRTALPFSGSIREIRI
jgi:5-deoxy-D-glucuronate isomerase